MIETVVTLKNPSGLHARPASQFVQTAGKFKGTTIKVVNTTESISNKAKEGKEVDSKSILAIMGLGAKQGTQLTLKADGPDAEAALAELTALIESGFGEA